MVKIIVTRALPEVALERLGALGDVWVSTYPRPLTVQELHEAAAGASALVTMPSDRVDAPLLAATGSKLKVVANFAVGYDNPSQFSREYRRTFGGSPSGDTLVGRTTIARRGARTGREAAAGETEVVVPVPWGQLPPLEIWSSLNWFRSPGATSSYGARAGPVDDG